MPLFRRFFDHYAPLLAGYSDDELRLLQEFLSKSALYMQKEIELLRVEDPV